MSEPTPETFETFGSLLRHLRRRARLTQRALGIAVGYSEAHIARLESDQRRPNISVVSAQFADALHLQELPAWSARLIALAGGKAIHLNQLAETENDIPNNLRAQLTGFVGRKDALAHIKELSVAARLLTLSGIGGVGKSRLAAYAATDMLASFADGVWMCTLGALEIEQDVAPAVAIALGLTGNSDEALPLDLIKNYLHERQALLVLDGCEHVVAACARLVATLLQTCSHLSVLATSREPLDVPGEVTWLVPPLTYNEAEQLFMARARAVRPDFYITDQKLFKQVCDRCEGLPLAIELAASRLHVLSFEQIAERLSDPFGLLTDGSRLALPKHQSLRALMDWSYDLLTEPERDLFRRVAALGNSWTLEQAEALFEQCLHATAIKSADVLGLLSQLVKKSLIFAEAHEGQTHYRMLDLVRLYARK